jgi:hypothetical protein
VGFTTKIEFLFESVSISGFVPGRDDKTLGPEDLKIVDNSAYFNYLIKPTTAVLLKSNEEGCR